jgi:hypothetical protein
MNRQQSMLEWFPVLIRYGGLVGVAFMIAFWALTDRFEPGIAAFLALMIGLNEGREALKDLGSARQVPPPPPVPREEEAS